MRNILTLLSLTLAAPAIAGGVADPLQPPVTVTPEVQEFWSGYYAGANAIYGQGSPTGFGDIDGAHFGIVAGYRQDLGNIVVGFEFEFTNGNISDPGAPQRYLTQMYDIGVEIGYDAGAFLPYATFGMAGARFDEPVILPNFDATSGGVFYGIGVDYAVTDTVIVGAEIVQRQFNDFPLPNTDLQLNTFSLTAAYQF